MSYQLTESLARKYSVDEILGGIKAAIRKRDPFALDALLTLLAVVDPKRAEQTMGTINTGLDQVTAP